MQNINTNFTNLFDINKKVKTLFLLFFGFFLSFQLQAADFFWVGGNGNWNDFATHWATTSGGGTFHANAPTATDNIFFDANSGAAGYTVTLDVAAVANNFTFSGNAFSFAGANSLTVNGTSTNSSTQAITFGGTNTYTFTGAYTAVAGSTTGFTGSGAVAFNNSVTIGNGSTFGFTSLATTTVTGAFNSTTTCAALNTINSTGGAANVTFNTASAWTNTDVTNIAATGSAVTLQGGSLTTSSGITVTPSAPRNLFWIGGTGNWNNTANWSLTTGGTGGECIPTATDDVNFDANSGVAGYTVTLNVAAVANNFTFSGNAFSFDGASSLTVSGVSTNSSTNAITFGGAGSYTFVGAYTASPASTTRFTTTSAVAFNNSVTIGNGSTFSFTPSATTTITGAFNSTTTCAALNTINSTGGAANVTFTGVANWTNTNITNIAATGGVTLQSGTITTSSGITDLTVNRNLFWIGGTGNWNNTANWSLTSGGTGGECIPTANDDVNFDGASGLAGGTVTLNVAAPVRNFNYDVAGATFVAANALTVNGITTIAATRAISFNGVSSYIFTGNFVAGTTTTTSFSSSNGYSFGNVTVGAGSTFRFSANGALATATVSGTFTPNGTCSNPVILSSTGGTAPVNFTNPQTWNGVNVSQINSTGANVTVNSISVVVTGNFTNNTIAGRTLFWVGGTGNWDDETHWSLTSGSPTGGECIPTILDDVIFNNASFSAAGQIVTMNINGICKNMTWTGITPARSPVFTGATAIEFTLAGSLVLSPNMTQTGNAPTFQGLWNFSSNVAQTVTSNGRALNRVQFQTGATASWTLQDAFLVQNNTQLISGTLNTNNRPISSGTLSTNNVVPVARTLNLGSSTITLTSPSTTVLNYGNDADLTLNSATSTINITATNSTIETGTLAKTMSNLVYAVLGNGNRVINTASNTNIITFQYISVSDGGTFNINGTSPKVYQNIDIGSNVGGTITGAATNLGNTVNGTIAVGNNGTTVFSGGYGITGNVTTGVNKTINFSGTGNNNFGGAVVIGNGGSFLSGGTKNNTFVGVFALNPTATATFSNTPAASENLFSTISMNSGTTIAFSSVANSRVTATINLVGSCAAPITLTSNNPPNQARLQLANALNLFGATVTNINATAQPINVSNGTVANNTNVTGNVTSRNLFWVHSIIGAGTANWYDAANWSATSGGTAGQCPPTIYDNVRFDANSFSAANQIVDMDNDAFCRNMNWTGVTNSPRLQSIGEDTDLYVGGNLNFGDATAAGAMVVGTGGTNPNEIRNINYVATEAILGSPATLNNRIDLGIGLNENANGRRFKRAFFDKNAAAGNTVTSNATWTFESAFNLTQEANTFAAPIYSTGTLRIVDGDLITYNGTDDFDVQIRIIDANAVVNSSLDMGNSRFTLRATGRSVDFTDDTNFTFITPGPNAFFNITVGSNSDVFVGAKAKELPDIDWNAGDIDVFTANGNNRITFRNITIDANANLNMTGNSPKTYSEPLVFPNGVNTTLRGSDGTTNTNIFTGAITYGTGVQARFDGDNQFQGAFTVGSTVNNTTGITFTGNGRNRFKGDVTMTGSSSNFFSLQNTSANPNTFTNVSIQNLPVLFPAVTPATIWEFSGNSPNTVSGTFAINADCTAPVFVRANTGTANVAFANNQTWSNVTVTNINETGAGTVTVLSGSGAGNTNIVFTVTNRTLYWVGNNGDWGNTNNWSAISGGAGGECLPTLSDDVFFDANSFNGTGQIVTINVDAETRDMTWTNATNNPTITGTNAFNLQMGGDVTLIATMNWNFDGETFFRYTDADDGRNTIISAGQTFNGHANFFDNDGVIDGIWELADAFSTDRVFRLTAGTFTTSTANHALRAVMLDVSQVGDQTRTLNLNGSVTTVFRNNGLAVDFRGNTTNFTLASTPASQIRLT